VKVIMLASQHCPRSSFCDGDYGSKLKLGLLKGKRVYVCVPVAFQTRRSAGAHGRPSSILTRCSDPAAPERLTRYFHPDQSKLAQAIRGSCTPIASSTCGAKRQVLAHLGRSRSKRMSFGQERQCCVLRFASSVSTHTSSHRLEATVRASHICELFDIAGEAPLMRVNCTRRSSDMHAHARSIGREARRKSRCGNGLD